MDKTFYITTPIFYASGKPQVGNAYSAVLADAIARYKKLQGYDVVFQTGMDEHGQKVQNKAKEAGKNPQDFVDEISLEVKRVLESVNVDYTNFARTTNPNHKKQVQEIFQKLYDKGDIYKGTYEGLYCTPCESFFTESQLIDGKCPDCGRDVHKTKEEAYFLNLKKYEKWLKEYIEENNDYIVPETKKNEMLRFIEQGLDDLCVSRTSFDWGIKVPFDEKHVIYVWLDALTNYITFIGYGTDKEKFNKYWPADIHIVGKDILRFHTVYWPIMLKALDLPITKQVLGHPFLVDNKGEKMSKSKGNMLYADALAKDFTADGVRYYLLSELGIYNDGNIGIDLILDRYNSDLANVLGNLVNRTISMSKKYFEGKVYEPKAFEEVDKELIEQAKNLGTKVETKMNELKIAEAINEIFTLYKRSNKYIDETEPWVLAKDKEKEERLKTVLYNLLESIRIATVYLQAFLPETADKIFKQLNTQNRTLDSTKDFKGMDPGITLNNPEILFQRIDKEEYFKEKE
ncbi:MAG: methionine--tRNA ligase [Bacilli bacterium]|nr:methionine--tRNA ligase [Bacilli bacterium]